MTTLSDLCLWKILSHVSGHDLLSHIEARFGWNQFKAKFASTRTSLTVLVGTDPVGLIENLLDTNFYIDSEENVQMRESVLDHLSAPKCALISPEHVHFLVDMFPQITHLVIAIDNSQLPIHLDHVTSLLKHWQHKLVSLALYVSNFKFTIYDNDHDMSNVRLLAQINKMDNLKRLKIYFKKEYCETSHESNSLPAATINQIEYVLPNEEMRQIQVKSIGDYISFSALPDELTDCFQSLHMTLFKILDRIHMNVLAGFCFRFVNLTHLEIKVYSLLHRSQLTRALDHLKQLVSFSLETKMEQLKHKYFGVDISLPQIPSVKIFRLIILSNNEAVLEDYSHSLVPDLQLHLIFPNLQVLQLQTKTPTLFFCNVCLKSRYDISECHAKTVASLVLNFDKLKRVKIGNGTFLIDEDDD